MGMTRKQISFDLSQDALKRYYPHKETGQDSQFFKRAYKGHPALHGSQRL